MAMMIKFANVCVTSLLIDQKSADLVRGQMAVMSLLDKLPTTNHSPESFVVDVAISLVMPELRSLIYCLYIS